jgi:hypothetical protein
VVSGISRIPCAPAHRSRPDQRNGHRAGHGQSAIGDRVAPSGRIWSQPEHDVCFWLRPVLVRPTARTDTHCS